MKIDIVSKEIRKRLMRIVREDSAEGILLSGGLDSSIISSLAFGIDSYTVGFESLGHDVEYARLVSDHLNLNNYCREISLEDVIDVIPDIIRILKTFDSALPNDIAIYFGIKFAKENGVDSLYTGDGGDELFAGYNYMRSLNLDEYMPKLVEFMNFSSKKIGEHFSVDIKQPFLDEDFISFSLGVERDLKIREEGGEVWGKWILRKAFEDILPEKVVWREKEPIEYGSGITRLHEYLGSEISDKDFQRKTESYNIKFRDKEHLFYYEIYRDVVGDIPEPVEEEKDCSWCGAGVREDLKHCKVCGGYPV